MSDTEKPINAPEPPPPPSFTEVLDAIAKDNTLSAEGKLIKLQTLACTIQIVMLDRLQKLVDNQVPVVKPLAPPPFGKRK